MTLSQQEVIDLLGLVPHPTCGLIRQTYMSQIRISQSVLPRQFGSDRYAGSVMYFMISSQTSIKLHKIHSDQMYHFYFGAPLEVLLLYPDGQGEVKIMGHDLKKGMVPQLFIPGDTFHISRNYKQDDYSLLSTSEWISVAPEDVELGVAEELIIQYPNMAQEINDFCCP
jgi:predicted cupin superfamily sugar epimerase